MIASSFGAFGASLSAALGGPYHASQLLWPGTPTTDSGGSITAPGTPVTADCMAQVDVATEAMRAADGFVDGDIRLIILSDTAPTTDARLKVLAGPYAGTTWLLSALSRDPLAVGWEARGRRAG